MHVLVPAPVVQVLPQQLDGGLRPVPLPEGQVGVVDEDGIGLAGGGPVGVGLALVQFGHQVRLQHVGRRARGEVDVDGHEVVPEAALQEPRDPHGLAGAGGPDAQRVHALGEQQLHQPRVADGVLWRGREGGGLWVHRCSATGTTGRLLNGCRLLANRRRLASVKCQPPLMDRRPATRDPHAVLHVRFAKRASGGTPAPH